nr:intraflagellar transport protein 88 homolog [Cherax quadricarinatus]
MANQYAAIDMFSVALNTYQDQNYAPKIGLVFVRMGQYSEACTSFEYIMQEEANFKTGLDLVTAYFALGDKERMKKGFLRLLECQLDIDDDEKYTTTTEDTQANLILEVIRNDPLRKMERQMKQEAERSILTAAKLISPAIENNFSDGYNWCWKVISKTSQYADLWPTTSWRSNKAVMFCGYEELQGCCGHSQDGLRRSLRDLRLPAPLHSSLGGGAGGGGGGSSDGLRRPMTSMRGTGYTSHGSVFDPLHQANKGPAPALISKTEESAEEKIKALERRVMTLIEESCTAAAKGEVRLALERAKEASSKERSLIRQREQAGLSDGHNLDLTFSVLFNLANQYAANDMFTEALNTYQVITKDRMFNNSGRLRVNMGNIYYKMNQYNKAVKFYRMALDQVPNTHKSMRIKIMHNIGLVFVRMGQYSEACTSFEYIMQEEANFKTGLDLVTAYFALGDKERMKKGFLRLLECQLDIDDDEKYTTTTEDTQANLILEVIRNDPLRKMERQMKQEAERSILTAAKLIFSRAIENNFSDGYNWCVEVIKNSQYADLANDLEINKAVMFLRQKNFKDAVDTLKMFEKKETKVASTAATNLSFLYFLQNETELAERYALMARDSNGYNDAALVNLGNCCYQRSDYEKAREHYIAALDIDASCVEALYNLGLTNKKLSRYEDALDSLLKMHAIVRNYPPVVYQIAHLYQLLNDNDQASEWYLQLLGIVPTDPHIHQRLGQIFDSEGDKQQAYQYYFDHPVAEKAISYFDGSLLQPGPGASARSGRSVPGSALSGGRATRLSLNDLDENEPFVPANKQVGE